MKLSWAYRLTILYIGFIGMLMSMAFLSSNSRTDLERIDYYEEELKHDEKMEAIKNTNELNEPIEILNIDDKLEITYPKSFNTNRAEIKIWVYCSADASKDKHLTFKCNESKQIVFTRNWHKSKYFLRFNTISNNKKYFLEKEINLK